MGTFVLTTAILKSGGNECHRSQVIVYLKSEYPDTYIGIPQLLLCMPYLLKYGDIEFGSHFEKWSSPRYAQFLKFPPSRILKPYVYITQINSQTSSSTKCLRAYRAGPGLCLSYKTDYEFVAHTNVAHSASTLNTLSDTSNDVMRIHML